jgi:hypothetical protein
LTHQVHSPPRHFGSDRDADRISGDWFLDFHNVGTINHIPVEGEPAVGPGVISSGDLDHGDSEERAETWNLKPE